MPNDRVISEPLAEVPKPDDQGYRSEVIASLRVIAANTTTLAESAPPKVRSWGWRLENLIRLGIAIAAAAAGWYFSKL